MTTPDQKTHYTAAEIAGLPGVPTTERRVRAMASRESWPFRKRQGRGGGREYPVSALPRETRDHLFNQAIDQLPQTICKLPLQAKPIANASKDLAPREEAAAPAVINAPDLGSLKSWQTRTMDARLAIIRLIEHAEPVIGSTKAIEEIVHKAHHGQLPEQVQQLIPQANARSGGKEGKATLSRRTLMRWWSAYKKADGNYAALAPASIEKETPPAWAAAFLKQYQVPQKISVAEAISNMRQLAVPGDPIPSDAQARRFLKKYSRLDSQRGRKSGSELRGQRLYRQRSTEGFQPLDITACDGHSFKAYIGHPGHGRPFHPEVCTVIDVVTRCAIGWSAGLAESSLTVADALRHACTVTPDKPIGGLPLIFYTDNGAGNKAKVNSDEVAGLYARSGIKFETGFAGNPQGRGIIERLNATLWIPAAKKLETYTGKDMDSLAARKVYLQLQKDVREMDKGGPAPARLMSWPEFLLFLEDEVDAYNNRPHRSLPRITCPETGRRRNMTPREAWASWLAKGWRPELLNEQELAHLFRPHERVKCVRGRITLYKNVYSDAALEHYHGMELLVGYDIHDPSQVWVRDENARLIVIAKRNAHKSPWFPHSKVDDLRENRYQNRKKNAQRRLEEIELERRGGPIETRVVEDVTEIEAEVIEASDRIIEMAEQRKLVSTPWERYEDICDRADRGEASDYELRWKADYDLFTETGFKDGLVESDEFCMAEKKERKKGEEG